MVSSPGNPRGLYLVRGSESVAGEYSCMLLFCSLLFQYCETVISIVKLDSMHFLSTGVVVGQHHS